MFALAVFAFPDKVGHPSTATKLIGVKSANGDPVGMNLSTRGALYFESIVEGRVWRVVWPQIRYPVKLRAYRKSEHLESTV